MRVRSFVTRASSLIGSRETLHHPHGGQFVMMKRPRSFISTLIVLLSLAFVPLGLTVNAHDANAGGMPRVMDPRAGDPTQPGDGFLPPDDSTLDPGSPVIQVPEDPETSIVWNSFFRAMYSRASSFLFLSGRRWPL
jgi:hypothetical protein